jgi:hypothetical protein
MLTLEEKDSGRIRVGFQGILNESVLHWVRRLLLTFYNTTSHGTGNDLNWVTYTHKTKHLRKHFEYHISWRSTLSEFFNLFSRLCHVYHGIFGI